MASPVYKILVIDTAIEMVLAVTAALKGERFSVISCSNSLKAIALAEQEIPHLVLVNLIMPELDGIDICLALRHKAALINTLIVEN